MSSSHTDCDPEHEHTENVAPRQLPIRQNRSRVTVSGTPAEGEEACAGAAKDAKKRKRGVAVNEPSSQMDSVRDENEDLKGAGALPKPSHAAHCHSTYSKKRGNGQEKMVSDQTCHPADDRIPPNQTAQIKCEDCEKSGEADNHVHDNFPEEENESAAETVIVDNNQPVPEMKSKTTTTTYHSHTANDELGFRIYEEPLEAQLAAEAAAPGPIDWPHEDKENEAEFPSPPTSTTDNNLAPLGVAQGHHPQYWQPGPGFEGED